MRKSVLVVLIGLLAAMLFPALLVVCVLSILRRKRPRKTE